MEFHNPQTLSEALSVIDKYAPKIKICAGTTHLLRFYNQFPEGLDVEVENIVHVGDIPGLSDLREEMNRYCIGAAIKITDIATDSYLARYAPSIIDAAYASTTPQVRNRRTVGGEIAWGSYHSPLIATLLSLQAKVRVRKYDPVAKQAREDTFELSEFYSGEREREYEGAKFVGRKPRIETHDLILRVAIPRDSLHKPGTFSFFRALTPKISTENPGVVVAVKGVAVNGVIHSAQFVASGVWMKSLIEDLPLEGVKMNDAQIFKILYSFCARYPFDRFRRSGPSGHQLGLVVFGLLKEGFSGLLGR